MFNSIGMLADNFFRMSMWTEPFAGIVGFEETDFPESWTVFYWAWWLVYAPFVGLFVSRISRGRTIREMFTEASVVSCILAYWEISDCIWS